MYYMFIFKCVIISDQEKDLCNKIENNEYLKQEWWWKTILKKWINGKNKKYHNLTFFWRNIFPALNLTNLKNISEIDNLDPETLTEDKNQSNEYIDLLLCWTSVINIREISKIKTLCNDILKARWLKNPNFQDKFGNALLMVMILVCNKSWILYLLENYWDKINFEIKNSNNNDVFTIIDELRNPEKFPWRKTIYQDMAYKLFEEEFIEIEKMLLYLKEKWLDQTIKTYKNNWISYDISSQIWEILDDWWSKDK